MQCREVGPRETDLGEELEDVTLVRLGGEVVREHRAGVALELLELALPRLHLALLLLA